MSELHTLPHFKPEEVAALKAEHERRESAAKIRPTLNPDDERIRDAIQRETFWRLQPKSDHQQEELAHCLFTQGKIDEALKLAKNSERRAYYESVQSAIFRDDDLECECKTPDHVIGKFPSAKHGGRLVEMKQCPECKVMNVA